jgi:X-linked retinitis pigmentosa GTPase regulator
MAKFLNKLLLALMLGFFGVPLVFAQEEAPVEDDDGSSEQVEQRDDAFRRQMELEDARSKDRTYVDNTYGQPAELEKIDKLPEESRNNIRDQLVDVIMENGEWEPRDALEEYPYSPTEAAQSDSELKQQEQEAWDEQIEKYHQREAAAFGSHKGPVPGPGNPTGQEGGEQGDGSEQGQQGGGQGGQEGSGAKESDDGSEGTYQPYQPGSNSSENKISTAGVSESALDFLKNGRGQQQPSPQEEAQAQQQAQEQAQEQADEAQEASEDNSEQAQAAEQNAGQAQAESQQESAQEAPPDTRGIIAIKDLDKLEGTEIPDDPDDSQDP